MTPLAPFWRYYGGKNRAARFYPPPEHSTIVEPFAGAAGYSCRYPDRQVVLIDASPVVAGVWRYLIKTPASEILSLPDLPDGQTVDDMPICQEARWLVGFWLNSGTTAPGKTPSQRSKQDTQHGRQWSGWGWRSRQRIAEQVDRIRHWQIICADYTCAPDIEATWFVDPPYNNAAGRRYPQRVDSFDELGSWCRQRKGFVMACENIGANWLPFRHLRQIKSNKGMSAEVVWYNRTPSTGLQLQMVQS